MFANTGTVSFWLYGVFILITIIAMIAAFILIKKDSVPQEKLDRMIDLFKYTIVSTALATVGLMVTDLFKEREQDVKELEYFDKYVQDVKKADGAEERWRLAKYLSLVSPSGEMKKSWENYYNYLDTGEHRRYLVLMVKKDSLDFVISQSKFVPEDQMLKVKQFQESIDRFDKPLVNATITVKKPTIYIQYCNRTAKGRMLEIQDTFNRNSWNAPGIEYLETGCDNSIRYFHDEDRALADQANNLLDNRYNIKRSYVKAPKGQIELWIEQ
jgi:hypothetical protein